MDAYNLSKKTQKKKITGSEIAAIGTLGALSLARALKDKDDVEHEKEETQDSQIVSDNDLSSVVDEMGDFFD